MHAAAHHPRVLLITADSTRTGAPRQIAMLARGLAAEGVEVHLASPAGWLMTELENTGVAMHVLQDSAALQVQRGRLREIIAQAKPQIVHSHGVRGGLWGRLAAHPNEEQVVYTEHLWTNSFHLSNPYRERLQISSLQWLDRRTHHTIAVSQATADFLLKRRITNPKKLSVIPGAVEPHPIQRLVTEPVIGTIGALSRIKGIDLLIEALSLLGPRYPNLRLQIAGIGTEQQHLEKQARRANISEHITWLGAVSDPDDFFKHIRVYVQASRSESFGLAPLEAMARGIPTIVTRAGALPELIRGGIDGLVADVSATGLAQEIETLLTQPDQIPLLSEAGHARSSEFSPPKMVDAHLELYRSLIR